MYEPYSLSTAPAMHAYLSALLFHIYTGMLSPLSSDRKDLDRAAGALRGCGVLRAGFLGLLHPARS